MIWVCSKLILGLKVRIERKLIRHLARMLRQISLPLGNSSSWWNLLRGHHLTRKDRGKSTHLCLPNGVSNLSCICLSLSLDISFLINRGWCLELLHRFGVLCRKIINEFWLLMICVIIIKRLVTYCTCRCRILVDRHYLILRLWHCHILMWRKPHVVVLLEISLLLILVWRC